MESADATPPPRTVRAQRYLCSVLSEGGRGPYAAVGQVFVPADTTTGRESFIFQCDGAAFSANPQNTLCRMTGGATGYYAERTTSTIEEIDLPASLVDAAYHLVVARRAFEDARNAFQHRMNASDDPAGFAPSLRAHHLAEIAAGRQGPRSWIGEVEVFSLGAHGHELFRFPDGTERVVATREEYSALVRQIHDAAEHKHSHD